MNTNRPEEFARVMEAKSEWGTVYSTYGGQQVQAVGPVMAVPPATTVVVQYQQTPQQPVQQNVVYQQVQQQGVYQEGGQNGTAPVYSQPMPNAVYQPPPHSPNHQPM